uniref:Uncharacterized protein n=1 Tax=Spironucleus salmonicida TaxID=348837 RepID=V6LPH8_9EUKA|eukprot:EST46510.1 Hypothetical protein SS50377_13316 [Spironucleus salmonicida]
MQQCIKFTFQINLPINPRSEQPQRADDDCRVQYDFVKHLQFGDDNIRMNVSYLYISQCCVALSLLYRIMQHHVCPSDLCQI